MINKKHLTQYLKRNKHPKVTVMINWVLCYERYSRISCNHTTFHWCSSSSTFPNGYCVSFSPSKSLRILSFPIPLIWRPGHVRNLKQVDISTYPLHLYSLAQSSFLSQWLSDPVPNCFSNYSLDPMLPAYYSRVSPISPIHTLSQTNIHFLYPGLFLSQQINM